MGRSGKSPVLPPGMKVEPPFLAVMYIIPGIFYYSYLSYKAESAGTNFIQIDPRNTTQMCSNCGSIVKKDLSVRVHNCPDCRFAADRDYNAAVNIHRVGTEQPFGPVEPGPLHHISVVQVPAMEQEAPHR